MEKVACVIIGAGAVGLAVACRMAERYGEVVVLEQHESFGRETSSRNSEVIHAGMYYPTGSLKARLCVEGSRLLYTYCEQWSVPFRKIGKLIIAGAKAEEEAIRQLYRLGLANGVAGLELLAAQEIKKREPQLHAGFALFSPGTGIFDTHAYMQAMEKQAEAAGAIFAYGCQVRDLEYTGAGYHVTYQDTDGQTERLGAELVINCSGLKAEQVAALVCGEIAAYRLYYSKGEYYSLSGVERGLTHSLIYPAPASDHLGIHTVLDLQGQLKLGPNAYYVSELDYTIDDSHREQFFQAASKYLPSLRLEQLVPDMAGIRPKLQAPGAGFADFVIEHETGRGFPGLINLIGIESPGLSASQAIAAYVAGLL